MGHIMKAGFLYLFVPETGHPRVHPCRLPVRGSIGDNKKRKKKKKWGGRCILSDSALTICSLRTKLISDTQGSLEHWRVRREGSLPQM